MFTTMFISHLGLNTEFSSCEFFFMSHAQIHTNSADSSFEQPIRTSNSDPEIPEGGVLGHGNRVAYQNEIYTFL